MNYDAKDPLIRCIADREGASVFTSFANRLKPLRVLTFSQADADRIAREWTPEPEREGGTLL